MNPLQIDFEKKLSQLGLSYSVNCNGNYQIRSPKGCVNHLKVLLISSLPLNQQIHVSKNGNQIVAIGLFKNQFLTSGFEPDIFVFAFQTPVKSQSEFLIVPTLEFWRRHVEMNSRSVSHKRVVMTIWLFEDGQAYDATHISPEGEWFFLSKGLNGRMADWSDLDYTEYLNSWRSITDR